MDVEARVPGSTARARAAEVGRMNAGMGALPAPGRAGTCGLHDLLQDRISEELQNRLCDFGGHLVRAGGPEKAHPLDEADEPARQVLQGDARNGARPLVQVLE